MGEQHGIAHVYLIDLGEAGDHRFSGRYPRTKSGARRESFEQALRDKGWIDGYNIAIEYRWAEGQEERYASSPKNSSTARSMLSSRPGPMRSSPPRKRPRSYRSSLRPPATGRHQDGQDPQAPGRQCHRAVEPGDNDLAGSADRPTPRCRARHGADGDHRQSPQSRHSAGDEKGGERRALSRESTRHPRCAAGKGYRARIKALKGKTSKDKVDAFLFAAIRSSPPINTSFTQRLRGEFADDACLQRFR